MTRDHVTDVCTYLPLQLQSRGKRILKVGRVFVCPMRVRGRAPARRYGSCLAVTSHAGIETVMTAGPPVRPEPAAPDTLIRIKMVKRAENTREAEARARVLGGGHEAVTQQVSMLAPELASSEGQITALLM